jgi:hypothetical protein
MDEQEDKRDDKPDDWQSIEDALENSSQSSVLGCQLPVVSALCQLSTLGSRPSNSCQGNLQSPACLAGSGLLSSLSSFSIFTRAMRCPSISSTVYFRPS